MKQDLTKELLHQLYCEEMKSSVDIGKSYEVSPSTVCKLLKSYGIQARTPGQGSRDFAWKNVGKKREFSQEHREKLRAATLRHGEENAVGMSYKTDGYVEYTRGPNKGRLVHVVLMEQHIGRSLRRNEVVHHRDENKHNNDLDNLELMTRSAHARLHRLLEQQRKQALSGRSAH